MIWTKSSIQALELNLEKTRTIFLSAFQDLRLMRKPRASFGRIFILTQLSATHSYLNEYPSQKFTPKI
jgi:hypothetical protein